MIKIICQKDLDKAYFTCNLPANIKKHKNPLNKIPVSISLDRQV
jgi:hypothetical protein